MQHIGQCPTPPDERAQPEQQIQADQLQQQQRSSGQQWEQQRESGHAQTGELFQDGLHVLV